MLKCGLINTFPREIGRPFKDGIVWDFNDIQNYIKRYGHSYGIHLSVYSFSTIENNKPDYSSAVIDKIFIDIDSYNWLKYVRILFRWCEKYNILSRYNMSGGGAHCFLFCRETIKYKRNCIFNFQSYLERKLKIKIDSQIKGDLSRTFRLPYTFNFKRNRYDICLNKDLIFNYDINEIYNLASELPENKTTDVWVGKKILDLKKFDVEQCLYGYSYKINDNLDILDNNELDKLNMPFDKFPYCVRSWLNNPDLKHKGRFSLIIYLRDQLVTDIPISYNVIVSILKRTLSDEQWLHVSTNIRLKDRSPGEGMRSIYSTYNNSSYRMYSCYQLRELGLCPTDCGRWHPIYE